MTTGEIKLTENYVNVKHQLKFARAKITSSNNRDGDCNGDITASQLSESTVMRAKLNPMIGSSVITPNPTPQVFLLNEKQMKERLGRDT